MISLYPFLFRFGVSFNYGIPKEIIKSIVTFFEEKYHIKINLTYLEDCFDCIAIKDDDAKDCTPILAYKFSERLQEYSVSDFDNSILFIDIKRAYSDKFIDSFLIPELIKIKNDKTLRTKTFPNFILYFDELDNRSLTYDTLFSSHSTHKLLDYCFVFDKNGKVLKPNLDFEKDKALHALINDISTSSLERFQFKLVRKINHFKRLEEKTKTHIACQQYFYEGRNCQDEAYQLIKDELMQMRTQNINPHYIIYDSFYSGWLSKAIETVANHISSKMQSEVFSNFFTKQHPPDENLLNLYGSDRRNDDNWREDRSLEVIFISDLIHTGNTFKDRVKKIAKKFPKSNIHCLSALITDSAFEEYKGAFSETERKIKIKELEIRYFKKVEQIYKPTSSNRTDCHMCKHKLLPLVETSEEVTKNLSSFEMWLMSEESGYKIEDYRPKSREDINRIIPDSLKLFKKNGTLLAIKFEQHLKFAGIYPKEEIVIIFPDETKDETKNDPEGKESIEKTPSGYFAKCLNFYNGNYSYLGIPRKMIRLLQKSNADFNEAKPQFQKIFQQIEKINKPIVIVDEVNISGKTFKTITDILRFNGKSPACYFPIFNFDAKGTESKYNNSQYDSIKFLNLYELDFAHE